MSKVNGLTEFAKALEKMSLDIQNGVKEIVAVNVGDLEMQAIRDAPGGGDLIRTQYGTESQEQIKRGRSWTPISQAITSTMSADELSGTVDVDNSAGDIAIWVEMGTGQSASSYLATTPPEWQSYARLFYINGRGTIIAQPYLLPAWMKYQLNTVKEIRALLKKTVK